MASPPLTGTIFDSLSRNGISWKNYAVDLGDTMLWGPAYFVSIAPGHFFPIADFYVDGTAVAEVLGRLRHGESIWNKENLFTGWTDVDLSEQGKAEALRSASSV